MKKVVLVGLLALACGLVPARPADAQAGFIRWLEKLSGPGPFYGAGFELYGLCYGVEKNSSIQADPPPEEAFKRSRDWFWDVNCGKAARNRQRLTVGVQFSKLWGDNNLQYDETAVPEDQRDTVGATIFLGTADLGVARALDVGAGLGFIHFTNTPPGGFSRVLLEPLRVTWKPLTMRRASASAEDLYRREWLQFRVVMTVIPGGFDAEDFGAIPGSYTSGTEVQTNLYIIVNATNLLKW
jgi:hypothetical protein